MIIGGGAIRPRRCFCSFSRRRLNRQELFTLPIALTKLLSTYGVTNYDLIMPASLLATLPPIFIYLIFQRSFVHGIALSGLNG